MHGRGPPWPGRSAVFNSKTVPKTDPKMFQLLDFYSNELQPSVSKHGKKNQNNQNDSGLQVIWL